MYPVRLRSANFVKIFFPHRAFEQSVVFIYCTQYPWQTQRAHRLHKVFVLFRMNFKWWLNLDFMLSNGTNCKPFWRKPTKFDLILYVKYRLNCTKSHMTNSFCKLPIKHSVYTHSATWVHGTVKWGLHALWMGITCTLSFQFFPRTHKSDYEGY